MCRACLQLAVRRQLHVVRRIAQFDIALAAEDRAVREQNADAVLGRGPVVEAAVKAERPDIVRDVAQFFVLRERDGFHRIVEHEGGLELGVEFGTGAAGALRHEFKCSVGVCTFAIHDLHDLIPRRGKGFLDPFRRVCLHHEQVLDFSGDFTRVKDFRRTLHLTHRHERRIPRHAGGVVGSGGKHG